MNTAKYLDRLLLKYSNTFNIYMPFMIGKETYPAYGHFFSHNEKYILVQEANMWSADSHEHILFWEENEVLPEHIDHAVEMIKGVLEEKLVRKGEKLPPSGHMSSLISIILLSQKSISSDVEKQVKKFRFDKGYQFNMRGYCRGRIGVVTMEDRKVTVSPDLKGSRKLLEEVFKEVEAGKDGFLTICEKQGIACYTQEQPL